MTSPFHPSPRIAVALAVLILALTPAQADEAAAGRDVIERQISAFLNNDMTAAYSYAAPSIKRIYPDETGFFNMVKRGYGPVFRPGNYAFGRAKLAPDGATLVQEVLIRGPNGQDWTAFYSLERQPDGGYKIDGVRMIKAAAPQT